MRRSEQTQSDSRDASKMGKVACRRLQYSRVSDRSKEVARKGSLAPHPRRVPQRRNCGSRSSIDSLTSQRLEGGWPRSHRDPIKSRLPPVPRPPRRRDRGGRVKLPVAHPLGQLAMVESRRPYTVDKRRGLHPRRRSTRRLAARADTTNDL